MKAFSAPIWALAWRPPRVRRRRLPSSVSSGPTPVPPGLPEVPPWHHAVASGAKRTSRRVVAGEPDPHAAAVSRSDALIQLGRWAQAEALLRPVLATRPDHPTALADLAWILRNTGRQDEAYEVARRLVAVEPDWPTALTGLSDLLCQRNEPAEAEPYARRVVQLDPENSAGWLALATVLGKLGAEHGEEALHAAREAVRHGPEWPRAHSVLSMTEFNHGDLDRAERSMARALALDPDHVAYHNALGMIQLERGGLDEALGTFQRAAALSPDATSIANIFRLLESHGVPEPFVELYTRLRTAVGDPGTVDPTDPHTIDHRLHYVDRLWERGARDTAWTLLEAVHRDNPEQESALTGYAYYALRLGRAAEALSAARTAVRVAPDSAEARQLLDEATRAVEDLPTG
ncbi:hypothetical protein C6W10_16885 [Plantactinospora sp. BB1]|nr:hypothetical protein C6W10_16885 [Plantactinospora sp. BB1]